MRNLLLWCLARSTHVHIGQDVIVGQSGGKSLSTQSAQNWHLHGKQIRASTLLVWHITHLSCVPHFGRGPVGQGTQGAGGQGTHGSQGLHAILTFSCNKHNVMLNNSPLLVILSMKTGTRQLIQNGFVPRVCYCKFAYKVLDWDRKTIRLVFFLFFPDSHPCWIINEGSPTVSD